MTSEAKRIEDLRNEAVRLNAIAEAAINSMIYGAGTSDAADAAVEAAEAAMEAYANARAQCGIR